MSTRGSNTVTPAASFDSRRAAGQALATVLSAYAGSGAIVLGLTRGGILVADEVARALHLPFDALVVHRIAPPPDTHLGVGALAEPDHVVVHRHHMRALSLSADWLEQAVRQGTREVRRRGAAYRGGHERARLVGRCVIIVDDAAGTGVTLQAAVRSVRAQGAGEIVVAVPVMPAPVIAALRPHVDRVVYLCTPAELIWRGIYYPTPGEVSDEDIRLWLEQVSHAPVGNAAASQERPARLSAPNTTRAGDGLPARQPQEGRGEAGIGAAS